MIENAICCPAETFVLFKLAAAISDTISYDLLDLMPLSTVGKIVHYSLLQFLKSSILLFPVIYLAGLIRSGLNPAKAKRFLEGKSRFLSYFFGSALGMITPFCSCAAVPIFVGFANSGIRKGVAIAFLVTAPLVSESGIALIASSMGGFYALGTVIIGALLGILSGALFDYFESRGTSLFLPIQETDTDRWNPDQKRTMKERHIWAWNELLKISKKIMPWLLFSVVIAAILRAIVPAQTVMNMLSGDQFWSVPLAVLVGIPMYGTIGTVAPIGAVLLEKGAAAGTVLAFMLSVSGASLPEFILIKQVVTVRGVVLLLGIFLISFMLVGFGVNAFLM